MSDGDVKKISDDLGKEIVQKHDLKHAETVEKNVLPTAADLEAEKVYEKTGEIKRLIEENPDLIKTLNHVVPEEKNPLPTKEQIEEEKKLEEEAKQA